MVHKDKIKIANLGGVPGGRRMVKSESMLLNHA